METIFKIAITAVVLSVIYYQLLFVRTVWKSQIDPRATIARWIKKLQPEDSVIATRDPTKIYQSGKAVGDVTGSVSTDGPKVVFKQLSNTGDLRADQPFEYQRSKLKIVSVASRVGMLVNMTESGSIHRKDVLGETGNGVRAYYRQFYVRRTQSA
jgi:hypothetical protein